MLSFADKRIAVLGVGASGLASAASLTQRGAQVTAFDEEASEKLSGALKRLAELGVESRIGPAKARDLDGIEMVVTSPGIPPSNPWLECAASRGIETIGEIELAWRLTRGTVMAVSGTNGKTTTTTLTGELMKTTGREVIVAGNIGEPFVSAVREGDGETVYVVEVSSFQLAYAPTFRPHVAAMLNLTPDHVNWHGSMEAYVEAKERLFANQTSEDWAVLNVRDELVRRMAPDLRSQVVPFSLEPLERGLYVRDGAIFASIDGGEDRILALDSLKIRGRHNIENALAACALALCAGASTERIAAPLASFEGVEHRLEKVAVVDGITYWNDSKATNPDAAIKALEAFDTPLVVLLGGRNKGNSFEDLARVAAPHARVALVFGEAREEIAFALGQRCVPFELYPTMAEAFDAALSVAGEGDDVLLSPACASFDEFEDFEQRGSVFKSLVAGIGGAG